MKKSVIFALGLAMLLAVSGMSSTQAQGSLSATGELGNKSDTTKIGERRAGLQGGSIEVALLGSDFNTSIAEVQAYLLPFTDLSVIDIIDVHYSTPSLSTLQNYDSVLVWSNYAFDDRVALGDVLADYVDSGGGVVLATFVWYGPDFDLEGRIMTDYTPFVQAGSSLYSRANLGWYNAGHAVMAGVGNISGYYRDNVTLTAGAELVAEWDDGYPFVATKGSVAGVTVYPGFDWTGDVPTLIHNALVWAAQPEPTFQYHFRLAPGANVVHLNTSAGGWLNGYMTLGPIGWNPVLGKYEAGRFYMAIDIYPDNTSGYYDLLFLVGTVDTRTGQLIQTYDGMSYFGPHDVTLVPAAAQSEELEGPDITEVSGSQVTPEAWYTFQVNPYIDIVHLNTNPGGWLNGYDEIYEPDAPVLGFAEGGRFYFGIDGIMPAGSTTLAFIAGKVSTRDGDVITTIDGTTIDGPYPIWLTPA